jgi:hypothetical protein
MRGVETETPLPPKQTYGILPIQQTQTIFTSMTDRWNPFLVSFPFAPLGLDADVAIAAWCSAM